MRLVVIGVEGLGVGAGAGLQLVLQAECVTVTEDGDAPRCSDHVDDRIKTQFFLVCLLFPSCSFLPLCPPFPP